MGNAGSPYGDFQTALRTGSFDLAIDVARTLPRLTLSDALRLTLLAAQKAPDKYEEMARRWLGRLMSEREPSLDELTWAAALLSNAPKIEESDDRLTEILKGLL
jgi:hypothetical protein